MNSSEVRKFIKQGEQATEVLEKLGYTYSTKEGEHPHWVAPFNPLDALRDSLEALIQEGIKAGVKKAIAEDPRGPNWHLVEDLIGKNFAVRPENIPVGHQLRGYGHEGHFRGRFFHATKIEYRRDPSYTGYAVYFNFALRPYRPETVWIPLSACAFRP